jgi:hypothetical protein
MRVSRERRGRGASGRARGGRTRRGRWARRRRVPRTRGCGIERRPKRRVVEVVLHVEGHLGRSPGGVPRFSRARAPRNSPLRRARHPPHELRPTPKHVVARFLRGRRVRRRAARRVPAPTARRSPEFKHTARRRAKISLTGSRRRGSRQSKLFPSCARRDVTPYSFGDATRSRLALSILERRMKIKCSIQCVAPRPSFTVRNVSQCARLSVPRARASTFRSASVCVKNRRPRPAIRFASHTLRVDQNESDRRHPPRAR